MSRMILYGKAYHETLDRIYILLLYKVMPILIYFQKSVPNIGIYSYIWDKFINSQQILEIYIILYNLYTIRPNHRAREKLYL